MDTLRNYLQHDTAVSLIVIIVGVFALAWIAVRVVPWHQNRRRDREALAANMARWAADDAAEAAREARRAAARRTPPARRRCVNCPFGRRDCNPCLGDSW
jgi:hypothetical protein